MVWVRSEYAGELAVLSVWANTVIPWGVSVAPVGSGNFVVIRFQFFLVQFLLGVQLEGATEEPFLTVPGAVAFESGATREAYLVWAVAAAVFAVAFLLSVAYYRLDERLEAASPVDPVRLLGALLVVTGLVEAAAAYRLWESYPGTTVPVGVVFCLVLGGLLLVVERA
jgi:uncharacterized protein (TIGR04206 family)